MDKNQAAEVRRARNAAAFGTTVSSTRAVGFILKIFCLTLAISFVE
jgi:hypothetical protein